MYVRHAERPIDGLPIENCFAAFADFGELSGSASVSERETRALTPECPYEYLIKIRGVPEVRDALLGAATSRALQLHARRRGERGRIDIVCAPDDEGWLRSLETFGFRAGNRLISMSRRHIAGPNVGRQPEGTLLLADDLADRAEDHLTEEISERRHFVERLALLSLRTDDEAAAWLGEARTKPLFARLLLVAPSGLVGELVGWAERRVGTIAHLYVAPDWRRKGAGKYLMECARLRYSENGIWDTELEVHTRLRPAVTLAASLGYRQTEVKALYPCIEIP